MSILTLGSKHKEKENSQSKKGRRHKKEKKRKIPNQRVGESKKGKKIPDQGSEENRRNMQKGLWTRQYLNNTELSPSKQEKERKPRPKVVFSLWLPTKILCVGDLFASRKTKTEKEKGQKHTKAKKPTKRTHSQGKPYWPMITHVIFDLIGNNLQSQVMTYLWFGIRMKHLPVRDWYTLSGFLLFLLNPVFPLNGHLETKC